jgi:hypothetical protein
LQGFAVQGIVGLVLHNQVCGEGNSGKSRYLSQISQRKITRKMTSRIALTVLLALFGSSVFAQNAPDTAALVASWRLGEKVFFQKTTFKQEYKNGQITKRDSAVVELSLAVTDSSDAGYVLLFQMEKLPLDIPVKLMEKFVGKFEYELETSSTGEYLGLRNWQNVQQFMYNMVDKMMLLDSKDKDEREQVSALVKNLFSTKEQIEALTFKEIVILLDGYGYEYPLNEEAKTETLMPNPFGGAPFQGLVTSRYELEDSNLFTMSSKTELEPVSTKAAVVQMLKDMAKGMGRDESEVEKELAGFELNVTDTKKQIFDLETGWLKQGQYERKSETTDGTTRQGKTERYTYRRIDKK